MGIKSSKSSPSNVLFSKAQQRVLGLLYSQPHKNFYTNEIIRLTNMGTGSVQRELAKLSAGGLIKANSVGNQKRYQADESNPLFTELRSIVLKTFGLADIIKDALIPVANNIYFAFIYGSIAKQEDKASSDIDLMIISDNLTYADIFKLVEESEVQLGRKINPTVYSLEDWQRKYRQSNNFVFQIEKQPKIFLIGTENEFRKLK